ncbi:hypothetical protein GQ600_11614 [Phytophthora cactorum]|nr:hypothetical protein GQ600_11614 [Phytophthora cactorum]
MTSSRPHGCDSICWRFVSGLTTHHCQTTISYRQGPDQELHDRWRRSVRDAATRRSLPPCGHAFPAMFVRDFHNFEIPCRHAITFRKHIASVITVPCASIWARYTSMRKFVGPWSTYDCGQTLNRTEPLTTENRKGEHHPPGELDFIFQFAFDRDVNREDSDSASDFVVPSD